MEKLAVTILMTLSSLMGIHSPSKGMDWKIERYWTPVGNHFEYRAHSSSITSHCKRNRDHFLFLPLIIHGAHQIFSGGKLIYEEGDSTFQLANGFYKSPSISCKVLSQFDEITWVASGYSQYFSRFKTLPYVSQRSFNETFESITMNLLSTGALILLALFSVVVFFNKVPKSLAINVIGTSFFFSIYFIFVTADFYPINMSMLTAHKLADLGLWTGSFFFFKALFEKNVIQKSSFLIFLSSGIFACTFIALGSNGDVVQLGTTIPFPLVIFLLSKAFFGQWKLYQSSRKMENGLQLISILSFTGAALYDIFVITGMIDGIPLFSLGAIFALFTFTLAVNDEITTTYKERDALLVSLEQKVLEKTAGLQLALSEKEKAQAELIQSAKLASLGTLSAGIAHEINNSINYVNGAVIPLEKLINKVEFDAGQKAIVMKLLGSIKDGSKLTVDIVRSLRNYTGLNQAKYADVSLFEVVENVCTILKSKTSNRITIENLVPQDLTLFGNKVGINQIFMNLISNSIDAISDRGTIRINATIKNTDVIVSVEDNGPGIPENIKSRIFDPFFTTKDVGSGTGLGLHIVKKEVENHSGKIEVSSRPDQGTTFTVTLPLHAKIESKPEAA